MIAIDVLKWPGVNQAFLVSFFGAILLSLAVIPFGKRRPKDATLTWGGAMLAGTYCFGVLFLTYGIVPHQWIDHADKNLGWSKDKIIYGPFDILKPEALGGWLPFTLQYEAVRDIVVVLLHLFFFALNIYLVVWWQNRNKETQKALPTSTYGRPLVKKA